MSKYLETMFDVEKQLREAAFRLSRLGHSFYETGNRTVAGRMEAEAEMLIDAATRLSKAVGEKSTDDLRIAQEGSRNVLSAALAGIELATRRAEDSGNTVKTGE